MAIVKALAEAPRQIANNAGVGFPVIVNRVAEEKGNIRLQRRRHRRVRRHGEVRCHRSRQGDEDRPHQRAASVAAMMLTTEAIITEIPEPKSAALGGGPGGMGGMEDMC